MLCLKRELVVFKIRAHSVPHPHGDFLFAPLCSRAKSPLSPDYRRLQSKPLGCVICVICDVWMWVCMNGVAIFVLLTYPPPFPPLSVVPLSPPSPFFLLPLPPPFFSPSFPPSPSSSLPTSLSLTTKLPKMQTTKTHPHTYTCTHPLTHTHAHSQVL